MAAIAHPKHLRLLPVLQALLAERSVTGAARRVHLSQPATSAALAQLRALFADPLLVRSGRGMVLTQRAMELLPELEAATTAAERVFASRAAQPPELLQRRFQLAVSDAVGQVLIPRLVQRLAEQAPGVTLRLSQAPADLPDAALADATLDLVVAHHERAAPGLRSTTLVRHPLVVVAREGHPAIRSGRLTARQFCAQPQVTIFPHAAAIQEGLQALFSRAGQPFRLAAAVQNLSVAAGIVAQTDAMALLSEPAARLYAAAWRLQVLPLPAGLALPAVPVRAFWHERSQHDPASAWLRRQLAAVCAPG
jgi:DNA-binding transcriptional LysR family regulator